MCNFYRVTPGITWTHLYTIRMTYNWENQLKKGENKRVQTVNKVGGKKPYSKMHEGPTIKPN